MASVNDIKVVIKEQEEKMHNLLKEENIINRELSIKSTMISKGVANIITGPRRCGKSVLAYQLAGREKCGHINFNDERLNLSTGF